MKVNGFIVLGIMLLLIGGAMQTMEIVDLTPPEIYYPLLWPQPNGNYTSLEGVKLICRDAETGINGVWFKWWTNYTIYAYIHNTLVLNKTGTFTPDTTNNVVWDVWSANFTDSGFSEPTSGNYSFQWSLQNTAEQIATTPGPLPLDDPYTFQILSPTSTTTPTNPNITPDEGDFGLLPGNQTSTGSSGQVKTSFSYATAIMIVGCVICCIRIIQQKKKLKVK